MYLNGYMIAGAIVVGFILLCIFSDKNNGGNNGTGSAPTPPPAAPIR